MGGTMRLTTITLAVAVALSSASFAETIAPGDIKFGESGEVEISLTGVAGDAAAGRKIFMNRKKGNCLACHVNSDCLLYTSPSPRDRTRSRMPSSA